MVNLTKTQLMMAGFTFLAAASLLSTMSATTTTQTAFAQQTPNENANPVAQCSEMVTGPDGGNNNPAYECSATRQELSNAECDPEVLPSAEGTDLEGGQVIFPCNNGDVHSANR